MAEHAPDDELARRIRSLEAERLRPVPPPPRARHVVAAVPTLSTPPVGEAVPRRARRTPTPPLDPGIRALRGAGETYRRKQAQRHGGDD
jgi:hypothetical protein